MPTKKTTKTAAKPTATKAKGLAPRHELFAQAVAAGATKTDAFVEVMPHAATWKRAVLNVKGCEMAARPDVKARIAELQAKAAEASGFTLEKHLERLNALSLAAQAAGDFTPAVKAEENRGRAAGFYVERIEGSGPGGSPLLPSVIKLVGPDGHG